MRRTIVVVAACLACGGSVPAAAVAWWRVFPVASVHRAAPGSDADRGRAGLHAVNRSSGTVASLFRGASGLPANRVAGTPASPPGSGGQPLVAFRNTGGVAGARQTPAALLPVERTVHLMGTWATLVARAPDRVAGLQALERMVRVIERTEASLSTWRNDSVLSALNRHPVDEPFALPAPLCGLWPRLARWHRVTGGAFDPAVGRLVEAWGLRAGGAVPASDVLRAAREATGFAHFRFDAETCRVTRRADATLDAGAFGKGEALRRMVRAPSEGLPWMVDFGGQIAVGAHPAAAGWPVAVAHPARRHQPALELVLVAGSLATSGASERVGVVEGQSVTHILDPRTGRPVEHAESVTVWHEDPLAADVLSTALYVMGADAGMEYAERDGIAALFLIPRPGSGAGPVTVRATQAFGVRFPAVARLPAR